MKKSILAVILIFLFTCVSSADDLIPQRAKGISMHMLPKRVTDLDGHKWGFMVSYKQYLKPEQIRPVLQTPDEFLSYIRKQEKMVQENGVWIVITNPEAYSHDELNLLEEIKDLCQRESITLFIALASQLPNGWVRY